MTFCAPGVWYRHLEVEEVLARVHARHVREIAAHNAAVTASIEAVPRLRDQVLQEFPPKARRLAR